MNEIEPWDPRQGGDYEDDRRYGIEPQQPQIIIVDRDRREHNGFMPPFVRRNIGKLLVAAVAVGGVAYIAKNTPECAKAVLQISDESVASACLPHLGKDSSASFSDVHIVKEEVVGDTNIEVYGEVSALVGSDKPSVFKYEGNLLDEWPGVADGMMKWNKYGKTEEVRYNICIVKGKTDKAILSTSKSADDDESKAHQAGVHYTFESDAAGNPQKLVIDAGYLDVCFPRIAVTPENAAMWGPVEGEGYNMDPHFGALEEATFRYMQDRLIIAQTQAEACPDKFVNTDALKESIAKEVIGKLFTDTSDDVTDAVLRKIQNEHQYVVNLGTPAERQAVYKKQLEDIRNEIGNTTRTIPDPKTGDTNKIEKPDFAPLSVKECAAKVITPVAVKAGN